jgi:hypothetical protein
VIARVAIRKPRCGKIEVLPKGVKALRFSLKAVEDRNRWSRAGDIARAVHNILP